MKILIVSMQSIHVIRWVSQLRNSGHKLYFFDILNGGYIQDWEFVEQHTNWRYKCGNFRGRYKLKKLAPSIHKFFENDVKKEFEQVLKRFKPDVVHSFVMYNACVPIFEIMKRYNNIKWIYSAWGNDLFYYRNIPGYREDIQEVLPNIHYMFADCKRDLVLAEKLGFNGKILGDFPGGGGYKIEKYLPYYQNLQDRRIILIKGYEQRFGKCSAVLRSLSLIKDKLKYYEIIVFGADKELRRYLIENPVGNYIEIKQQMTHECVLELMGKALIYIGNSISDGMPNTLLESIIMGAFPIQSNPGGASAEVINNEKNGLLINNPESEEEIANHILHAINDVDMLKGANLINKIISQNLSYEKIKKKVLKAYNKVENELDVC